MKQREGWTRRRLAELASHLTAQGPNPPGGAYDYVIDCRFRAGRLAGRARALWDHDFLVNHQRRVFEKDLGPDTAAVVAAKRPTVPTKRGARWRTDCRGLFGGPARQM
jgi:hypothetical protein